MLCMIFCIGGGSLALAGEVTLTTADYTWEANNQVEQTIDDVTFNFKGGSAVPAYYSDGLRTYEGCVITISSESNITKIDFTYTIDNSGNLTLVSSEGKWTSSSKSWTGYANSVALKVGHSSGSKNGQVRITKIVVTTEASTSPTLKPSESSLGFGNVETGSDKDLTFKLKGFNLTADAALSITGDNADMFSVSPLSVSHTDGTISETPITVKYKPTSTGSHTATLNISAGTEASTTVALSGTGIDPLAHYTVSWKVNGADYNEGNPSTDVKDGSRVATLPTAPSAINGKVFVGWTNTEISTSQDNAPSVLFNTASSAPAVTANTTYYAVFATQSGSAPVETLSQTLEYDTWTYSGSTTDKSSYRLFHTDSYIESAEFDLSTLSKVVVYGGTFRGDSYNKLNIGDGTNTWKDVTVSGNSETGVNTYTDGTPLSGTGKLRITSKSGTASTTGVRISKVEIYTKNCSYSGYATTINVVSTDPSSNLTLSQTTGEVNIGETLDLSNYVTKAEGYTGTVTYAVTTGAEYASVSEAGVITGLAVGTATIKVIAPAIVGSFSESSAEFTVTVVENRTATTVTFGSKVDDQTFSVKLGETFEGKTATVSPAEAGNVTYSSDNAKVASVDENTGAITLGRIAGTATITASFAKTATYLASSAKYYINVIDPNGLVFYESFDKNEDQGGNDGIWKGISKMPTLNYDNSGWSVENESGANKCARFGIINAKGSATTPAIDLSGGKYILTFKAGAWNAKDEKTAIDVVISDGKLTYNGTTSKTQTIEMKKAEWTDYTMTIAGATNNATITFTAKYDKNNRFFLDEVKIVKVQAPEPTTSGDLTFKAQDSDGMYYATFSSNKDVVFTNDVIVSAVSVADKKLSIINLTTGYYEVTDATVGEETGIVEDGYYVPKNNGVLISCTDASAKYYFPKTEQTTVTLSANQLKPAPAEGGVFTAETDYKYYKLAYDDYSAKTGLGFYWGADNGGAFSVKAGTAYLAVPPKSEPANVKGFSFDGASTGVSAVGAEEPSKTRGIYNIAGQKVNAMTKAGLYIVNGKKIVIRK